jgi:hypothetical protein
MSTAAADAPDKRLLGVGATGDAAIERGAESAIREASRPRAGTGTDRTEVKRAATASASAPSDRPMLTFDQRFAIRRSLEDLAALEENRGERIAAAGMEPLAAYDLGIRYAVHDALAKLTDESYGDCETCRNPIPVARLEAVPYARRCVACQAREEHRWDQVGRLVGGVVRRLRWEPQGRSEMARKSHAPSESSI